MAVAWLLVVAFHALLADHLPYVVHGVVTSSNGPLSKQGPSWRAWFGADQNGRDIFSYCVYGARASMFIGLATASLGMVVMS